jgi:hypothetical protein
MEGVTDPVFKHVTIRYVRFGELVSSVGNCE